MKKYVTLTVLTAVCYVLNAQKKELRVRVSNIDQIKGNLMIAVYDSKKTFTTPDAVAAAKVEVTAHSQEVSFPDIVFGEYAVILYHDLNSDGELDTNFMGIPSEPYGFSNGSGFLGIPSYSKSRFNFGESSGVVEIELN